MRAIDHNATDGIYMPAEAFAQPPHVNWKHIDGPLMSWACQLHWLTRRERIALFFKRTTLDEIATRRFPGFGVTAWRREPAP